MSFVSGFSPGSPCFCILVFTGFSVLFVSGFSLGSPCPPYLGFHRTLRLNCRAPRPRATLPRRCPGAGMESPST